jgi:Tfp pilus assembly protein PilO
LHDVSLKPLPKGREEGFAGNLVMDVTARTYRYIEEEVGSQ